MKCKCCGIHFKESETKGIENGLSWFADYSHLQRWIRAKNQLEHFRNVDKMKLPKKPKVKRTAANKAFDKKVKDSDVKVRKKAAKTACHKFIRERDRGNSCICCELQLGEKFDAGHFLESGNNSFLRYHEDNIHAQSVHCNQYKGGDSGDYEANLRQKIGNDRVNWLKAHKGGVVKRKAEDYREIENYYKAKLKELEGQAFLGVVNEERLV